MINGINNVINAAYPRYAYPCFTTANNPNCAIANAKNVKINVAMAFLTKCPFCLSCSDLIRRSTALTHLVTIPEIMFTAVEIDPRMIKTEMIGVNNPEDTPFCTKTNIGTVAVTRSAAYATANNPMMDNSIAKKLNTKISMAALLICFLSVTGSICWYITDTDANWKKWWNGGRKYLRYDEPGASGGYYTQDDMKEIIAYARQHYITIIPEIEMPSHSEEVLAAYPQLSCSGEPYKNADFCVGNE